MQYKICGSSHWKIALSVFFLVYHSVLADKLVNINYSEKSLEWAETDTDSDSDCELLTYFSLSYRLAAVERLYFYCMFLCFVIHKLIFLTSMLQTLAVGFAVLPSS